MLWLIVLLQIALFAFVIRFRHSRTAHHRAERRGLSNGALPAAHFTPAKGRDIIAEKRPS